MNPIFRENIFFEADNDTSDGIYTFEDFKFFGALRQSRFFIVICMSHKILLMFRHGSLHLFAGVISFISRVDFDCLEFL